MKLSETFEAQINLLQQTVGGIFGLFTCIQLASDQLDLSNEQVMAFCRATPNGEVLWQQFTLRRDDPATKEDYNFADFMVEVLADTDHPVKPNQA